MNAARNIIEGSVDLSGRPPLDRWLRFAAPLQERYDAENGSRRTTELQSAILVGLAIYNVYNFTSIVLLADLLGFSIILRLGIITPLSLSLVWLIGRTRPSWTEWLVTVGMINSFLLPIYLFWATQEPLGLLTFGEMSLCITFGCVLLGLRFLNAAIFIGIALVVTFLALATKDGLDITLGLIFAVQFATACAFGLVANYRMEKRRCLDYLSKLAVTIQAESARETGREFEALSHTDELTQLPNRRLLMARLEEWLAEGRPMAVMMIDIDFFKFYNDALGHPAGDACLKTVAHILAHVAVEHEDAFCARFGGEEFTFVCQCSSEVEAARTARSLVQAIAAADIDHPARPDGLCIVTASIGVAHAAHGTTGSFGDLLAAADNALYRMKRGGRNGYLLNSMEIAPRRQPGDDTRAKRFPAAAVQMA